MKKEQLERQFEFWKQDTCTTFIAQEEAVIGSYTNVNGHKYSSEKAPMGMMFKQFSMALEAVAMRSKRGHIKYEKTDHDWMNFKRVPDAIEQYSDGAARHLCEIGNDEDYIGHAAATAWNALARLQLILENKQNA